MIVTQNIGLFVIFIGGILIFGMGLTMMNIKKINTINLLPAILVPVIYYIILKPLIRASWIAKKPFKLWLLRPFCDRIVQGKPSHI